MLYVHSYCLDMDVMLCLDIDVVDMAYVSKKHKLMEFFFSHDYYCQIVAIKFMMFNSIILFSHKILIFLLWAFLLQL